MFKFSGIDVESGARTGSDDRQWVNIDVALQDTESDQIRGVALRVVAPRHADVTMREIEEAARSEAVAILEAALGLLKGSSLAELAAQERASENEAEAERRREWEEQFPGHPLPF